MPTTPAVLPSDYPRRRSRARQACARLRKLANQWDSLMECSWYGEEAAAREQRLSQLEQAAANTEPFIQKPE